MYKKRVMTILFCFVLASATLLMACGDKKEETPSKTPEASSPTPVAKQNEEKQTIPESKPQEESVLVVTLPGITSEPTKFDEKTEWGSDDTFVSFEGQTAKINGAGCTLSGNVLEITTPGTYVLSGSFDGSVKVSVDKSEKVRLVLNNVNIQCSDGPAIVIESADKVGITLAEGTTNEISDASTYKDTSAKAPNACIYSKDDLSINGNGFLNVKANFHNGIDTKNDLCIVSGNISVSAVNHALKGNDSVSIFGGEISLVAGKDGIQSDTEDKEGKGFVYMKEGNLSINAEDDGIQAVRSIRIDGGQVSIASLDAKTNCAGTVAIAEGVMK